jgi:hypothetical protein
MEALGGERRYSSYSFTTSALDRGEWSASRPGRALPPGKGPPVPIVQEAGWAPEPVWTQEATGKILCPCRGSNPARPVLQPVVRHCTDWANPELLNREEWRKLLKEAKTLYELCRWWWWCLAVATTHYFTKHEMKHRSLCVSVTMKWLNNLFSLSEPDSPFVRKLDTSNKHPQYRA